VSNKEVRFQLETKKKQISFSKKLHRGGTPLSRSQVSSLTMVESRTLLCCSHVSSVAGGCTGQIYYQGVVSVEKGSVIIRCKLPERIKKVSEAANPPSLRLQA